MKQINKISKVLLVLLAIIMICSNISIVFASFSDGKATTYTPKEFTKDADGTTEGGEITTSGNGVNNIKTTGGKIVGLIRIVGTIVAVGMLIVVGIKYMMGSAEERAEYKKTLFPYLVGAVLIFAASNITQIVYSWASNI